MSQRSLLHRAVPATSAASGLRTPLATVLLLTALVLAGCGTANATSGKVGSGDPAAATASAGVSSPADEICEDMTRANVAKQLSVGRLNGAPVRTKSGTVTTCTYRITGGSLRMTVDERGSDVSARREFTTIKREATAPVRVPLLGTEAFTAHDGTTVTIKDDKVLTISPTELPAGNDRKQIAQSLSFEILTCWTH